MRLLHALTLVSLVAVATVVAPAPLEARCAPAVGYNLALVSDAPVAPGGTLLLRLSPVHSAERALTFPLTRLRFVPRGEGRTRRGTLRTLGANLLAVEVPRLADGRYRIASTSLEVTVRARAPVAPPVTTAPVLASPPLGRASEGSRSMALTIDLGAPPPGPAVGLLATWTSASGASSWFSLFDSDRARVGPPRCSPDIAGYQPIQGGEVVAVAFVDAAGNLSPTTSFTATLP